MKIKTEHLAHMRGAIDGLLSQRADTAATYAAAGLSLMRYRWDVARAAGLIPFFCDTLYAYANDSHIDTALRAVFGHKE